MKVAFWSNSGKAGVTSCMLALSVSCALGLGLKVTMLENHDNQAGAARYLFGLRNRALFDKDPGYLSEYGLRGASWDSYGSKNIEILENRLSFILQDGLNGPMWNSGCFFRLSPLLKKIEESGAISFIDTTTNNSTSKEILEEADAVIVVLKKDKAALEDFFFNQSALTQKAFYVLSDYQEISPVTLKQITKYFMVPEDRIVELPYCPAYFRALENGSTMEYLKLLFLDPKRTFFKDQINLLRDRLCKKLGISGSQTMYISEGGKVDTYRDKNSKTHQKENSADHFGNTAYGGIDSGNIHGFVPYHK